MNPILYQINTSRGGVPKSPVESVWVSFNGIKGDHQKNQTLHGGRDRALSLFSLDLIEALRQEGHTIGPGSTGENLTLSGIDWTLIQPGHQLRVGQEVYIEIISFAEPCRVNAKWFVNGNYKRISQKANPGWSRLCARVVSEGFIRRGDLIHLKRATTARAS